MHRREDERPTKEKWQERHAGDWYVHGEKISHRLTQVIVDAAAQPNSAHNRAEVVVQQDERGGFARDVGAATAHRNSYMSRLERRCIVYAVTRHRDDFTVGLECAYDSQLLFRHNPRKDRNCPDALT